MPYFLPPLTNAVRYYEHGYHARLCDGAAHVQVAYRCIVRPTDISFICISLMLKSSFEIKSTHLRHVS